jgi:peptidoglycan/xylan/chitin deacetylase (PgdA/CDA1 family)
MNKNKIFVIITAFMMVVGTSCKHAKQKDGKTNIVSDSISENVSQSTNQPANSTAQIYAKHQIPVLCYHRISDGNKGDYTVSPATFSSHMKILADSGYHSISPDQLYGYLAYNKTLPTKPFIVSFDDSRVEHAEIAAPILEKHGFRGAFFIMTITYNKKNYMTKDQIAALVKAGHTVGLHSWDHTMVIKYKEAADWQKQVVEPKKKLEGITGKPVEYWADPNGVYDHKSVVELSKYFKLSFSLATKRDSLQPLQCIRRIIVPECSPEGLLKSMRRSFSR